MEEPDDFLDEFEKFLSENVQVIKTYFQSMAVLFIFWHILTATNLGIGASPVHYGHGAATDLPETAVVRTSGIHIFGILISNVCHLQWSKCSDVSGC